ncbi:MAG TPA: sigma factor-like helix-turn-helix DNA-binding protein, partial [Polyangiaceae bacterium]
MSAVSPASPRLAEAIAAAQSAWPAFALDPNAFARFLAERAPEGELPAGDRAADLYLTFACAARLPLALKAFDALLTRVVRSAVSRIDSSEAFIDYVAQELRGHLLLGDPPRILGYAGLSPLTAWLRTVSARCALDAKRGRRERPHESLPLALASSQAPELEMLRARYRGDFEDAARRALRSLEPRDRAVLALSVRDGLSSAKLAALYGISRATASRWVAAAREKVVREAHRELKERLG